MNYFRLLFLLFFFCKENKQRSQQASTFTYSERNAYFSSSLSELLWKKSRKCMYLRRRKCMLTWFPACPLVLRKQSIPRGVNSTKNPRAQNPSCYGIEGNTRPNIHVWILPIFEALGDVELMSNAQLEQNTREILEIGLVFLVRLNEPTVTLVVLPRKCAPG